MPKTACFFIGFFLSFYVKAQQLPLETYTPEQGLVDARINKIFQDSKGRIYFLTREGFSIFDGQRFDNYGATDNRRTEIFTDITEYKDGTVKLFSFDGNMYTVVNNRVTIDSSQKNNLLELNKVFDIGNDEKLIITNYYIIKEKNNRFEKLRLNITNPGYLNLENAIAFKQYLLFSVFVSSKLPKIYLYNFETQQVTDSMINKSIYRLAADKENNLYFYSEGWQQFNTAALSSGKLQTTMASFAQLVPKDFRIFNIQFDNDNNAWLTNSEKGYCKLNLLDSSLQYFAVTSGILSNANFIFEDIEKNYWFVSSGRGVQKLQRSPLVKISTVDNTNLDFVLNITRNETGESYINSSAGLFLGNKKLSTAGILDRISFFWQDQYWKFTDYKTLAGSKGTVLQLDQLIPDYTAEDYQPSYPSIDNAGRLVISGKTLLLINKDYSVVVYKLPYFCDNIIADTGNIYWCFLRSNYVIRLQLQNNTFTPTYSKFFTTLNPRYVIKWNSNTFIAGTRLYGLQILQWLDGDLKITGGLNKKNGLSNNFVNVLLKKNNYSLLAGTGTGLDRITFAGKDTIIENLSARNSIFSSFNNLIALNDSSVLCQTLDGQLLRYVPLDSISINFLPTAFIKKIIINNSPIDPAAQNRFGYNNNNFEFNISAPSFVDNRNTRFHFMLTGNHEHWEQNTTAADFQINNLLPGSYQLTVTVQFPGKVYPDQQLNYAFVITPPFWKEWWFILLAALLATAAIFSAIRRYYLRKLEKQKTVLEKELAIEQERTRMSRELHDGLGSMLSGIKHSFAAMKNQLELSDSDNLKFHSNIDKLNESIKELRNISHSMASDSLLKYGLENSLSDYCRNINEPGVLNISFAAIDTGRIQLTEEQSFHIFRIVQELLQNAIKHADAKHAILQISYNAKRLYITVEDDGKGFEMNDVKHKKGLGLKNVETRVKILKGRIDYQTSFLKGTSVLIEVPCTSK